MIGAYSTRVPWALALSAPSSGASLSMCFWRISQRAFLSLESHKPLLGQDPVLLREPLQLDPRLSGQDVPSEHRREVNIVPVFNLPTLCSHEPLPASSGRRFRSSRIDAC